MIQLMSKMWYGPRGENLKKEVQECLWHLDIADPMLSRRASAACLAAGNFVQDTYGNPDKLTDKKKKEIFNNLRNHARELFHKDKGKAYGFYLYSAFLESQTLPRENEKFISAKLNELISDEIMFESTENAA